MEFQKFRLSEEVKSLFSAHMMVIALREIRTRSGSKILTKPNDPATHLFSDRTASPSGNGYILSFNDKPSAFIEPGDGEGFDWKYYNNPDPEKATVVDILVLGDPAYDLYYINPSITVERVDDHWMIANTTTANDGGYIYDTPRNRRIQSVGVNWFARGIGDGKYVQGGLIPTGDPMDWNRGGDRRMFTFGLEGETQTEVDYLYNESDQNDRDQEILYMTVYHGLKQSIAPIAIPFETILKIQ